MRGGPEGGDVAPAASRLGGSHAMNYPTLNLCLPCWPGKGKGEAGFAAFAFT